MSYLIRINERSEDFTPSDKKIAEYVLGNASEIPTMNSESLAKATGTSQSAIIRFVQKLGYKSYIDLKIDIVQSLEDARDIAQSELINASDGIAEIIEKSNNNVLSAVEKTYALLDRDLIAKVVDEICQAKAVYLTGVGSSGLICEDFLYKLQRAGKKAFYERDSHTNLSLLSNMTSKDLLICISYGGNTKEIQVAAEFAKEKDVKVVTISKSTRGKLANLSDYAIIIPEIEKEMRYGAITSRISSQIVTDILFYGYVVSDMDKVVSNLHVSKKLTDKLKG